MYDYGDSWWGYGKPLQGLDAADFEAARASQPSARFARRGRDRTSRTRVKGQDVPCTRATEHGEKRGSAADMRQY